MPTLSDNIHSHLITIIMCMNCFKRFERESSDHNYVAMLWTPVGFTSEGFVLQLEFALVPWPDAGIRGNAGHKHTDILHQLMTTQMQRQLLLTCLGTASLRPFDGEINLFNTSTTPTLRPQVLYDTPITTPTLLWCTQMLKQ